MRWLGGLLALALAAAGCSAGSPAAHATPQPRQATAPAAAPSTAPAPAPVLPPYAIESLRTRQYPGGKLEIGDVMSRGQGFTK
jgi:hypothetical protein